MSDALRMTLAASQGFEQRGRLGPTAGAREAWHRGRRWYAVWLVPAGSPAIRRRVGEASRALSRLVSPPPEPHVTLWVAGFPTHTPALDDDVSIEALLAQQEAVGRSPLRLKVGAPDSFLSCAVLQVSDHRGDLRRARERISRASPSCEIRFERYTPHVTVGTYRESGPATPVLTVLSETEPAELLPLRARPRLVLVDALRADAPLRRWSPRSPLPGEEP